MQDEPSRNTRRGPLLAAAVAVIVVFVTALAAASPRPALMESLPRPRITASAPAQPMPTLIAPSASPLPVPDQEPLELPDWIDDVLVVLLVAGAVVVLVWFLLRLVAASRSPAHRAAIPAGGHAVDVAAFDDEELAEAVRTAVSSLRRGIDVDDAIIECWRRLEEVAAGSGIERRPEQTSQEFTADVLTGGSIDEEALRSLAGLYRVAMFSTHRLTDDDRERAIAALERLSEQLRGTRDD